jgi:hypothetical protein
MVVLLSIKIEGIPDSSSILSVQNQQLFIKYSMPPNFQGCHEWVDRCPIYVQIKQYGCFIR